MLSDSTYFVDLFKDFPKLRLQKEMLNLANIEAHKKFVNFVEHIDTSEAILIESMKRQEVSLLSTMFTVNLTQPDVRVTKPEFTSVARQFVCLPPLSNGSSGAVQADYKCGCGVQKCTNPRCQATSDSLDAAGNHGLVCNPGVKAMRATLFERALEVSFRRAGGNPARQPSTYSLLGEVFSKDDLSKLFPGKLSKTEADKRKLLAMEYLDIINEIPRGHIRTAKLGMLRERFPDVAVPDDNDASNGIIRFDLKFPGPSARGKPREVWLDHAIVQETCPTHAAETLKFLKAKRTNLIESSPAFTKTYGSKTRRFSALVDVAKRLTEERKLKSQPNFMYPIVSSLGYFNEDMKRLLKFMEDCFKLNQSRERRCDGLLPGVLKGRFKVELKNTLCFALVRANALALNNQGLKGVTSPH